MQFIFEAYEGLASVTTIDPKLGLVILSISPGAENDVELIIQNLTADGILIEAAKPF